MTLLFLLVLAGCNKNEKSDYAQQHVINIETTSIPSTDENKTLIAFFSQDSIVDLNSDAVTHATPSKGNTKDIAEIIQSETGGEVFEIVTEETYPLSHQEASKKAEKELENDIRPKLISHVENMDQYDTVFIGYPIWWYVEPMAIRTFVEEYNFSGKKIIPFCTSLSVGIEESQDNIKRLLAESEVLNGLRIKTASSDFSQEISNWLSEIKHD